MQNLPLITWDIYEIRTTTTPIHGVMLRGRLRKLGMQHGQNVLCENASDIENVVRFSIPTGASATIFEDYLHSIMPDAQIEKVLADIPNPVLSKLKVNKEDRYTL